MKYKFNKTIKKNLNIPNIDIIYANLCEYSEEWHSILHQHPFTELMYILEGDGHLLLPNSKLPIKKDDLLILNSDIKHSETGNYQANMKYIAIGIQGINLLNIEDNKSYDSDFTKNYIVKQNYRDHHAQIRDLFYKIYSEYKEKDDYYETYSKLYAEILIINLLRISNKIVLQPNMQKNKQMQYIKSYLDIHYSRDISLENLSKMVYMSKFHLIKKFKEYYNITPIEYLTRKRVASACYLLLHTDHSMKEISYIVGIQSTSYFSKIFKERIGLTPSYYRNNAKRNPSLYQKSLESVILPSDV